MKFLGIIVICEWLKQLEMSEEKIESYKDLRVFQRSYNACLIVMKQIVPNLPDCEKYDLKDQLSRSSKAIPRLIAEGYAKKHQKAGFQKYLDDAMGESNETGVSMCQAKDIYSNYVDVNICDAMVTEYDIIGRQLFRLRQAWNKFSNRPDPKSNTWNKIKPKDDESQSTNTQTGSSPQHPKPNQ